MHKEILQASCFHMTAFITLLIWLHKTWKALKGYGNWRPSHKTVMKIRWAFTLLFYLLYHRNILCHMRNNPFIIHSLISFLGVWFIHVQKSTPCDSDDNPIPGPLSRHPIPLHGPCVCVNVHVCSWSYTSPTLTLCLNLTVLSLPSSHSLTQIPSQ